MRNQRHIGNEFNVYFHLNKQTGCVFYVGIGNKLRAGIATGRSIYWHRYVNKHGGFKKYIYKTNLNWMEACHLEIHLIKIYGRKGIEPNGVLVNRTTGGSGSNGCPKTQKQIDTIIRLNKTRVISDETRNKISVAMKSRTITSTHRDNMRRGAIKSYEGRRRKIMDVKNNILYDNLDEAVLHTDFSKKYFISMLSGNERNKSGMVYFNEFENMTDTEKGSLVNGMTNKFKSKAVLDKTTGTRYGSRVELAKGVGVGRGRVIDFIRKNTERFFLID